TLFPYTTLFRSAWLETEAKRLGVSISELVRRLVDEKLKGPLLILLLVAAVAGCAGNGAGIALTQDVSPVPDASPADVLAPAAVDVQVAHDVQVPDLVAPEAQADALAPTLHSMQDVPPDRLVIDLLVNGPEASPDTLASPDVLMQQSDASLIFLPWPTACPTKQIEPTSVKTCGVGSDGVGKALLWPTVLNAGYTIGFVCHYNCSKADSGDTSMPAAGDWACRSQINRGTSLETIVCLGTAAGCSQCIP